MLDIFSMELSVLFFVLPAHFAFTHDFYLHSMVFSFAGFHLIPELRYTLFQSLAGDSCIVIIHRQRILFSIDTDRQYAVKGTKLLFQFFRVVISGNFADLEICAFFGHL